MGDGLLRASVGAGDEPAAQDHPAAGARRRGAGGDERARHHQPVRGGRPGQAARASCISTTACARAWHEIAARHRLRARAAFDRARRRPRNAPALQPLRRAGQAHPAGHRAGAAAAGGGVAALPGGDRQRAFHLRCRRSTPAQAQDVRMVAARYTGLDRENRPFVVTAEVAHQTPKADDAIALDGPKADLTTLERQLERAHRLCRALPAAVAAPRPVRQCRALPGQGQRDPFRQRAHRHGAGHRRKPRSGRGRGHFRPCQRPRACASSIAATPSSSPAMPPSTSRPMRARRPRPLHEIPAETRSGLRRAGGIGGACVGCPLGARARRRRRPGPGRIGAGHGNQPIHIEAEHGIEWQQTNRVYIARGHASATRGQTTVHADTLYAYYRQAGRAGAESRCAATSRRRGATSRRRAPMY